MQIAALVLAWEEEAINPMIDSPPLQAEKKPPALAGCKRKPESAMGLPRGAR
jgi:hypothetical protein